MSKKILIGIVFVLLGILLYYQFSRKTDELPDRVSDVTSPTEGQKDQEKMKVEGIPPTNKNPDLTIDNAGLSKATVVVKTNKGKFKYKFFSKDAPNTVKRMVELINQGFYNGLSFHRVIPGFVAQGGDPLGNGTGGSGVKLLAEFNRRQHLKGTLSMARAADPNSADSQFYVCLGPQPHLNGNYTVFGQTVEGMETVEALAVGDRMEWIVIE